MDYSKLNEDLAEVQANTAKVVEQLDKAQNNKLNKFYNGAVRLFSLLVLIAAVYTAVVGFGGSAAVLALLFLSTWFLYCLQNVAVNIAKSFYEAQLAKTQKNIPLR